MSALGGKVEQLGLSAVARDQTLIKKASLSRKAGHSIQNTTNHPKH